ncbi:MAG: hypothetical protein A3H97_00070 [Acidobacteria bacterium RIFCSPLOWO2_02_FULL_65_29]|nr:MAG: hypothetical protein A3H97_00070 [Acidobacteria bacterium RIFCSPLOWO2_02_FULL_65_29]
MTRLRTVLRLSAALMLLDASITFGNVWPTPAIRWTGQLSFELAVCLLVVALAGGARQPLSRRALSWLSALWLLLVVGRYADVTAPALYGRDVNLYWDLQFMPDVAAMVMQAAPFGLIAGAAAAAAVGLLVLFVAIRWAVGQVDRVVAQSGPRRLLASLGIAGVTLFAVQEIQELRSPDIYDDDRRWVPVPVTVAYARQARLAIEAMTRPATLAPSPPMDADFARVRDADVYLIFIESYGAVSWERPEFARGLAAARAALEADIHATNRNVVSAYIESPTFGGNSWLAHISLLSGVEVRDPHTNALLMREKRDTLATAFSRAGYRTLALMPGLQRPWPEGRFYGFDETYTAETLRYPGPDFGWFGVPDQMSLAWLDAREINHAAHPPLFVFFPTLSTHFPFSPRPPYQPNWPRLLTDDKYDAADLARAYEEELDWVDFGPAYVNAVAYVYATIGGYLRLRPDRDVVMILVGDHQPPAAVSGEGAPWDVPVHIVASRQPVLDRLVARGFRSGLAPARPTLSRTHELLPVLLEAFGDHR